MGEDSLKYPLAFDEVKPADYEKWPGPMPDMTDLRTRSASRVKNDPEFRYLEQDIAKMDQRIKDNSLSLNKADREAEIAADKKRIADIKAERLARHVEKPVEYALTLADVDKPKLALVGADKDKDKPKKTAAATTDKTDKPAADKVAKADDADAKSVDPAAAADDDADADFSEKEKPDAVDPIKTESLSILEDLAEQQRRVKLASGSAAHPKG